MSTLQNLFKTHYSHCLRSNTDFQHFRSSMAPFPSLKQYLMQTCCTFKPDITEESLLLQLYCKQQMTPQSLLCLHLVVGDCVDSCSAISQSVRNYFIISHIGMNKSRWLRWARCVANMGKTRNTNRALVGEPEGRRQCGRHRHRLEG